MEILYKCIGCFTQGFRCKSSGVQMRPVAALVGSRRSAHSPPGLPVQLHFPLQCGVSYSVESMRPVVPAPPAPPSPYTPTDSQSIALPVEKGHTKEGREIWAECAALARGLGGGGARW